MEIGPIPVDEHGADGGGCCSGGGGLDLDTHEDDVLYWL